jgi:hypothetical protein
MTTGAGANGRKRRAGPAAAADFHFDIMCPWAYQASIWMRDVGDQLGLEVGWRFFSLEEINRAESKKHPWEREWSYGWSMMRIGALLRRIDPGLLDRWNFAAGTARAMTGWLPASTDELLHFDGVFAADKQVKALSDQYFAALVTEIFAARRADLAALTEADLDRPSWTPAGVRTYGRFLEIRIFDFWVHERDITTPLGWPADHAGWRAEIALAEVEGSPDGV